MNTMQEPGIDLDDDQERILVTRMTDARIMTKENIIRHL